MAAASVSLKTLNVKGPVNNTQRSDSMCVCFREIKVAKINNFSLHLLLMTKSAFAQMADLHLYVYVQYNVFPIGLVVFVMTSL